MTQRPFRILVAEDSRPIALVLAGALRGAGFEVVVARDGEECLGLAHSAGLDLVLLDLMLPKVHGLEVLKQLKSDPQTRNLGVIVCSAKDFKTEMDQAREWGVFEFMAKPVQPEALLEAVGRFFAAQEGGPFSSGPAPAPAPAEVFHPRMREEHGAFRLWGTRGSIPVSGPGFVRHGGNTSCMEVLRGEERLLFDAGSGLRDLGLSLLSGKPRPLHLFITHTHWDHIQGFPFFAPAYIPGYHITIYAPSNVDKDLESIFRGQLDRAYFPVQLEDMRATLAFKDLEEESVEISGVRVSWEHTVHPGATVGYKIEIEGRSLAYVPDNEFLKGYFGPPEAVGPDSEQTMVHARLVEFLAGVDVLIHEAQYTNEEYLNKVGWGHTSLTNGCALARLAGVKRWTITHHDPVHDDEFLEDKLNLTRQVLADLGCRLEVLHAWDGMEGYL